MDLSEPLDGVMTSHAFGFMWLNQPQAYGRAFITHELRLNTKSSDSKASARDHAEVDNIKDL